MSVTITTCYLATHWSVECSVWVALVVESIVVSVECLLSTDSKTLDWLDLLIEVKVGSYTTAINVTHSVNEFRCSRTCVLQVLCLFAPNHLVVFDSIIIRCIEWECLASKECRVGTINRRSRFDFVVLVELRVTEVRAQTNLQPILNLRVEVEAN